MVLSHFVMHGHRNRLCWDREAVGELFLMSKWVLPSTIITFFADQADRLLVGSLCVLSEVGLFHLAAQLCMLPTQLLGTLGGSLLLPLFSEGVRSGATNDSAIRHARRGYLAVGTVMSLGLLVAGPFAVRTLFGASFASAGWMTQTLAVGVLFRALGGSGSEYFRALGRFRMLMLANAVKVPAVIVFPLLGFNFYGLSGLLIGLVAADAARYLVLAYWLHRAGVSGLRDDVVALAVVGTVAGSIVYLHLS
jgi:O-antigen/teichoic acid export membrane protein